MSSLVPVLPPAPQPPLKLAISECLVGGKVRYDGGHKRDSLLHEELADLFEFQPVCPEVGIGLGVPRDPIHLVGVTDSIRAVGIENESLDVTVELQDFAAQRLPLLGEVDGHILTRNSPSCGLHTVKLYSKRGATPEPIGRGIYAAAVTRLRPNLPLEENGRLHDPPLRDNFVTRVFIHSHWRALVRQGLTAESLIAFHSAYENRITDHSISGYRALTELLTSQTPDVTSTGTRYFSQLMQVLKCQTT